MKPILFFVLGLLPALANAEGMTMPTSIPTVGEGGLVGLALTIGLLGARFIANKNKK